MEKEKGNKQKGPSGNPHGIRPEGKKDRRNIKNGVPGAKARREPHHKWKRRRATLPHPLECSTIAAPGLSYRVRNGTGRLTRAMTTANLTATAGKPKESKPPCHRWRFGNRLADARRKAHRNRIVTTKRSLSPGIEAQERRGTNPP